MTMLERALRQSQSGGGFKRNPLPLPVGNTFKRLLTARAIASLSGESASEVAARMWPSDRVMGEIVERATSAPAMTTVAGWAAELAQLLVADTLEALGPVSAAAQMAAEGLVLAFDGRGIISVPGFVADATQASWVQEGEPIPVRQLPALPAQMLPYKLASIAVLTQEMIDSSNAEQLIGDVLARSAGLALDASLFDANAATPARPAGIRNGISTLTASNNSDPFAAFAEDIAALVSAVAAVGGPGPYAIVSNPGRAASMAMRFIGEAEFIHVFATPAVGNLIVSVALPALVMAISAQPDIETSNAASLHMDTAPSASPTAGARKSMFQTNSIALKVRWPASWALRDPRAVAWLTPSWK